METRGYVLINVEVGKAEEVAKRLRSLSNVMQADVVTGTYDVVAVLECPDTNTLGRLVMNQVHGIPGLKTTLTLIALS